MTYRLSTIAAVLLLWSTAALASGTPRTTDEARAQAAVAARADSAPSAASTAGAPVSTDEARAPSSRVAPVAASRPVVAFSGAPISTDAARTVAADGALGGERSSEREATMACGQACHCTHG